MHRVLALTTVAAAIGLAACSMMDSTLTPAEAQEHADQMKSVDRAVAVMRPTQGNDTSGVVYFQQEGDQLTVEGRIKNLEPGSKHGFHVHQYGNTTAPDGTAAGGHYNPEDNKHALPPDRPRHAGDLGNIEANGQGVAQFSKTVSNITIAGVKNPIMGRGVIVHAKKDDGGQPTGHAGNRIAQGVIGVAGPQSEQ